MMLRNVAVCRTTTPGVASAGDNNPPKIGKKKSFFRKEHVGESYGQLEGEGSATELGLGQHNVIMKSGFY